ncbi:cytochrome c oxidase subunit 2A [Sutcliffiella horikoshii]|uniref:cytochrome c oxidase subunit 2A n=1 Tax=Sutcliffiella horikoshii TaxID=79883 RepID=UPI001CC0A915|nr:cytochrome c oxidase subunit 2A [Sutcliffiella horikoshii]UAL47619.1 cytochrome c oxidase subunit 2A [Sutcliffiella horikoshii]
MANLQYERPEKTTDKKLPLKGEEASLKGTLIAVFMLGAFIVISWISVFSLFISRN